jgi:hypothetical protein
MNVIVKTQQAKKNSLLPFGVLVTDFLTFKEIPKQSNELTQKIKNPINSHTLAQSSSHITPPVQGATMALDEVMHDGQGEPSQQIDIIALLEAQVQGLCVQIHEKFAAVTGRFNSFDQALAEILARLGQGHQ